MHIHVNGEDREIAEGSSVSSLLGELELPADRVAVEINLKIIDRGEFDAYVLHKDDRVEILSFIGGGSAGQTVCAQSVSRA
ncbi:MAG: sulfur carrier protein ThiS [Nitrospirota bacterium]|nr:MAG: sulfur carrier protein ThiS [Nitrospirota bacterium]